MSSDQPNRCAADLYPQSLEIPLAISALVLATVLVWVVRRRYALTLPRVALSAVASVVVLVVAGVASYAVWRLALLIDPAQVSAVEAEPYRPFLYRFAMLLASLAAVLSLFALVRRWLGAVGLAAGMLVVLAVAGVLVAFTLPGVSGSGVQPTLVVAAGAVVAVLLPERHTRARASVYLLALAVAAIMLGPGVWIGFDIGLNAGPRPVRDRSDETRGERMSHALVQPGCGTSSRARWSGSLVQPRLQFHATHSSTASPADQKTSRWSSPSRSRMVQAVLTKLTSRDGGCCRSLVIER